MRFNRLNPRQTASVIVAVVVILSTTFIALSPLPAHAPSPSVVNISLPAGQNPISLAYDGIYAYYASNAYGSIFRVDPIGLTSSTILATNSHQWIAVTYSNAISPKVATLYLLDSSAATGGLYAFFLTNNTLTQIASSVSSSTRGSVWVAQQCVSSGGTSLNPTCARYQSFIYAMGGQRFYKIENLADVPGNPSWAGWYVFPYNCRTNPVLCSSGSVFPGAASDSSGNLWFSDTRQGQLFEYVASTNTLQSFTGFSRPMGVAVVGTEVEVAENNLNGNIDDFSPSTNTIVSKSATTGTPFSVTNDAGSIAWSSNGTDHQVCILSGTCVNTGEQNWYLVQCGVKLCNGYTGTSGVSVISNLVSLSTYTLTSFISSWTDSQGNIYVIAPSNQYGAVTSSTSTSSTSTSSSGAKYSAGQTFAASDGRQYTVQTVYYGGLDNVIGPGCGSGWYYYTVQTAIVLDSQCAAYPWATYALSSTQTATSTSSTSTTTTTAASCSGARYSPGQNFIGSNGQRYTVVCDYYGSLDSVIGPGCPIMWRYYTTVGSQIIDQQCPAYPGAVYAL